MAKRRKVLLALVLALVMVMATACAGGEDDIKRPVSVNGDTSVTSENENAGEAIGENKEDPVTTEITIAETVLYDANNIKVTATGYEDSWMGPEIKILVENNSDKNALITAASVSANGYMMSSASLYAEVTAGKKANETFTILSSELEQSGIETLAELQFYIQLLDPESWEIVDISELVTLTTSAAPFDQPVDDAGDMLYDSNGIKIVCKGLKQDIIWDGTVVFYMENNSGKAVSIYAENVSVNGFMQDVELWANLRDETKLIDGMSMIDLSDIEIKNINQIENIEFNLRVVDANTWEEIVTTDAMTLNFK